MRKRPGPAHLETSTYTPNLLTETWTRCRKEFILKMSFALKWEHQVGHQLMPTNVEIVLNIWTQFFFSKRFRNDFDDFYGGSILLKINIYRSQMRPKVNTTKQ